ncbi:peptidoglycan D,D-transpeptidase FtsI family protein [Tenuibacillus multivorans]|uniref:serine-type D-Ala-D-Ala carboxypeptidase n=1 Tax=Tenuibacillus multivorans TaxID=237069 RepID=A0A1G9ZCW6_9BACI|nr:penicillin-binding protein 2 [Tenuibacillus multivorans]GEL77326.1 penicillin-binding protein [Tenuibacillus multivorans]SDN18426.1 Cell division protein FtsI/penicillin-binding protein 2 [Tenuibacillus multivorans]
MGKKKQKSHLPLRLNVLFFVIFLLFSILILQLGVVQILYGEDAQAEIDRTENVTSEIPTPRGKIYDRNGNVVVDNSLKYAITYTPQKNVQPEDNLKVAEQLSQYMKMEPDSVTERNMKDYWILKNRDEAYSRLTAEEKTLGDLEQYYAMLEDIDESDLSSISEAEMEVIAIKRELDQAIQLTPHVIKSGEDVTKEEYAVIAEHAYELPGISVSTDWSRENLFAPTLSSFIGGISDRNSGLPKDKLNYYLARNYKLNDRVGESGIEEEYELYLQGKKEIRQHVTNSDGEVIKSELIREGERGKDLMLSIDMEMQQALDQIIREEMEKVISEKPQVNRHFDKVMAVMMDPNTGEIIAVSGHRYIRGDEENAPRFRNEAYRALYDAHLPGSTVKGATILSGLDSGVIEPGTQFNDHPLQFAGSPDKSSWTSTIGVVDDIAALKESSNVYMFRTAMRLGGHWDYVHNNRLRYNGEGYSILSNYFRQFGLGVHTGVDYPFEENGFLGDDDTKGYEVLDMAIGQFENYTTLQLAQYVSTIANGGYRLEPHLVKQIHNPSDTESLGPIYKANEPTVLNKIDMDQDYLERVQEGFRQAFQEPRGTAYYKFADAPYNPAGKTGTAESAIYPGDGTKIDTINLSLVGYAPYDNPEIAFAIVAPHLGESDSHINNEIGRRLLDTYFELKEKRQQGETESDPNSEEETENVEENTETSEE